MPRIAWWEGLLARVRGGDEQQPVAGQQARRASSTILEKVARRGGLGRPRRRWSTVYVFRPSPITRSGFVYMDSPGYDPCSVTGHIASGAKPSSPSTTEAAARSRAYQADPLHQLADQHRESFTAHMEEDMDVDCGDIVSLPPGGGGGGPGGVGPMAAKGEEIFELLLRVRLRRAAQRVEAWASVGAEFRALADRRRFECESGRGGAGRNLPPPHRRALLLLRHRGARAVHHPRGGQASRITSGARSRSLERSWKPPAGGGRTRPFDDGEPQFPSPGSAVLIRPCAAPRRTTSRRDLLLGNARSVCP